MIDTASKRISLKLPKPFALKGKKAKTTSISTDGTASMRSEDYGDRPASPVSVSSHDDSSSHEEKVGSDLDGSDRSGASSSSKSQGRSWKKFGKSLGLRGSKKDKKSKRTSSTNGAGEGSSEDHDGSMSSLSDQQESRSSYQSQEVRRQDLLEKQSKVVAGVLPGGSKVLWTKRSFEMPPPDEHDEDESSPKRKKKKKRKSKRSSDLPGEDGTMIKTKKKKKKKLEDDSSGASSDPEEGLKSKKKKKRKKRASSVVLVDDNGEPVDESSQPIKKKKKKRKSKKQPADADVIESAAINEDAASPLKESIPEEEEEDDLNAVSVVSDSDATETTYEADGLSSPIDPEDSNTTETAHVLPETKNMELDDDGSNVESNIDGSGPLSPVHEGEPKYQHQTPNEDDAIESALLDEVDSAETLNQTPKMQDTNRSHSFKLSEGDILSVSGTELDGSSLVGITMELSERGSRMHDAALLGELELVREQLDDEQKETAKLKEAAAANSAQVTELQQQVSIASQQLEQVREQLVDERMEYSRLKIEADANESVVVDLQDQVSRMHKELEEVRHQLDVERKQSHQLQKKSVKRASTVAELEDHVALYRGMSEDIQEDYDMVINKYKEQKNQNVGLINIIANLKRDACEHKCVVDEKNDAIALLEKHISTLQHSDSAAAIADVMEENEFLKKLIKIQKENLYKVYTGENVGPDGMIM